MTSQHSQMPRRKRRPRIDDLLRKQCNVCDLIKPASAFAKRQASTDGLCYTCRECAKARSARWKRDNPTAWVEWFTANRERLRESFRQWRTDNAERHRENYRSWAKSNPDRVLANVRHRELAKARATPKWSNKRSMLPFYTEACRLTRDTGIKHEVDHIVPLRGRTVCGLHVAWNLQVITRAMNKRKNNRHDATAAIEYRPEDSAFLFTRSASDKDFRSDSGSS